MKKGKPSRLLLAVATVAFASALAVPALAMANEPAGSSFSDVEGTEWFAGDVGWANGEGQEAGIDGLTVYSGSHSIEIDAHCDIRLRWELRVALSGARDGGD